MKKNEEAYITKSNLKSIIMKVYANPSKEDIEGIYKEDLNHILSLKELAALFILKEAYAEKEFDLEKYMRKHKRDTKSFVFEGGSPSYHTNPFCEKLNSSFTNFELPEEIKAKGEEEIIRFRRFFIENASLLKSDEARFFKKLEATFFLTQPLSKVSFDNSGYQEIKNLDLKELESKIDSLLFDADQFRNKDEETKKKIKDKGYGTHITPEAKIPGTALYEWHNKYKTGLKELLEEYFRVKFNPELKFDGNLLESLGFISCKSCSQDSINKKSDFNNQRPF